MVASDISERINRLFDAEQWGAARRVIEQGLAKLPLGDWMRHWWLTRLSTTYYEERDYEKALGFVWRAHAIAPNCPLVLWDLAGTLDMLGDTAKAAKIYRRLLGRGARAIAKDQCGEGLEWATSLMTDSEYRLAACSELLGEDEEALRWAEKVLQNLDRGVHSIYTREEANNLFSRVYTRLLRKSGEVKTDASGETVIETPSSLHLSQPPSRLSAAEARAEGASLYTDVSSMLRAVAQYTSTVQDPRTTQALQAIG